MGEMQIQVTQSIFLPNELAVSKPEMGSENDDAGFNYKFYNINTNNPA